MLLRALGALPWSFLLVLPSAFAAPSVGPIELEQCSGAYTTTGSTRKPSPHIRVPMVDAANGLRIGKRHPSRFPSGTRGLWRFDTPYRVTDSGCGADLVRTNTYYFEPPGRADDSEILTVGVCTYATNCDTLVTTQAPLVLDNGICPAAPVAAGAGVVSSTAGASPPSNGGAVFGGSYVFGAAPDLYATANDSITWNMPVAYALSAWVKTSDAASKMMILQHASTSSGRGWGFGVDGGCLLRVDSREPTTAQKVYKHCGPTISDGNWHYLAVVRYNGLQYRYFVDGLVVSTSVAVSSHPFAENIVIPGTTTLLDYGITAPLVIGASRTQAGAYVNFFRGQLDEVRFQGGAISDDTMMLEYNTAVHKFSDDGGATYRYQQFGYNYSPNPWPGGATDGQTASLIYEPTTYLNIGPQQSYVFMTQSSRTFATTDTQAFSPTIDRSTPSATTVTGSVQTTTQIQWTWTVPAVACGLPTSNLTYRLYNSETGALVTTAVNSNGPFAENLGGPNTKASRHMQVDDLWGTSLSLPATYYSFAAAPTALAATAVTTGSISVAWNTSSNPGYTRYELSYSSDAFVAHFSTPIALADNYTGNSFPLVNIDAGTTYYFRVRAYSAREGVFTGVTPTSWATADIATLPPRPVLAGAGASPTSITWSWNAVAGASGYRLYGAGGGPLKTTTSGLSYTEPGLSINAAYGAEVEPFNASGPGLRSSAVYAFTHANPPTGANVVSVTSRSITVGWGANSNPGYTSYEVTVAANANFSAIATTKSTTGTSLTVGNLFPSTQYHARVRAFSGNQLATAYSVAAPATTSASPLISQSPGPSSPYSNTGNSAGIWHLDESTGATAADAIGGNAGTLTCLDAGCVSTPTWVSGRSGLGSAVQFTGATNSLVRIPDAPALDFPGSITVSAWAKPSSAVQASGAGILAKGTGANVSFGLDVFGGKYRFVFHNAGFVAVQATSTIRAGQWDHVVGVYDAGSSQARIYVNGQLSATQAGVAPGRVTNASPLALGGRQSGAGAFDLGFGGAVDDVRVLSVALGDAQAAQLFADASLATLTFTGNASTLRLTLPANAFGAAAQILATMSPLSGPINAGLGTLLDGLASAPTGQVLVPNTLVEIVPLVDGVPFVGNLGSSATLSLPYSDADNDGLVDGLQPPVAASTLRLYVLDGILVRWDPLPTTVDTSAKRVSGLTPHFSIFAMFGTTTIGTSLGEVKLYPNPWRRRAGDRFDAEALTFERLPASGTIRIHSLAGDFIRDLAFSGSDAGRLRWDGRNHAGREVASGVYFAFLRANDGSRAILKFAVER